MFSGILGPAKQNGALKRVYVDMIRYIKPFGRLADAYASDVQACKAVFGVTPKKQRKHGAQSKHW